MLTTASTLAAPVPRSGDELVRAAIAIELGPEDAAEPVPCAARPSTRFAHPDGPCRCFFGGPAPRLFAVPVGLHSRS